MTISTVEKFSISKGGRGGGAFSPSIIPVIMRNRSVTRRLNCGNLHLIVISCTIFCSTYHLHLQGQWSKSMPSKKPAEAANA
jgi:hypothetical protein